MVLPPGTPRALYVAAGAVVANGRTIAQDDGLTAMGELGLEAGAEGAAIWRFELTDTAADPVFFGGRGAVILEGAVDRALLDAGALIRLDSVAFPPGGAALLHIHQGPGIRRLSEGTIRIDTEGRSSSYGPGGAWFEAGPEPVFAQAAATAASRFIRAMILPRSLAGISSIQYVREEDRDKPKTQTYRGFGETLLG